VEKFTFKDLARMGKDISVPLRLEIDINSTVNATDNQFSQDIVIEKIFRILPGKRLVGLCEYKGRWAVAKIFFSSKYWERHLRRELRGSQLLIEAGQSVPQIVEILRSESNRGGVLLTKFLAGSETLGNLWSNSLASNTDLLLIFSALESIASCHNRGLWQEDIHLDNFLVFQRKIYLLDSGSIKVEMENDSLSQSKSLDNLALFFAQFPVWYDKNIQRLFSKYLKLRNSQGWAISELGFIRMVKKARKKRLELYSRKLFRSTSAHLFLQSIDRFLVYDRKLRSADFDAFVENPDGCLQQGTIIKDGNSSTIARVKINGHVYILKRYNIKGFLHRLKRLFRPSRAYKSWKAGHLLEMLGIGTAHPIMCLEQRFFWIFRRRAYLLCDEISGDHLLSDFDSETKNLEQWERVFASFRVLFDIMNEYKISHGDMKATNFIYSGEQLYVLDLDSLQWHQNGPSFSKKFSKDLKRFRKNWFGTNLEEQAGKAMANFMYDIG
jgi:tRNA A-37 threonylcarbamoyl transferase component Bud32